jgi:hypothetical protein
MQVDEPLPFDKVTVTTAFVASIESTLKVTPPAGSV